MLRLYLGILLCVCTCIALGHRKLKHNRKTRFCDLNKNRYYNEQSERCNKCNKCPRGHGIVKEINFVVDSLHGALGCRACVECTENVSYSNRMSYKECKPCRNCTQIGKTEIRPCMKDRNTRCAHTTNKPEKQVVPAHLTPTPLKKDKNAEDVSLSDAKKYFWITVSLMMIPTGILLVYFRKKLFQFCGKSINYETCNTIELDVIRPTIHEEETSFTFENTVPRHHESASSRCAIDPEIGKELLTEKEKLKIAKKLTDNDQHLCLAALMDLDRSAVEIIEDENRTKELQAYRIIVKWAQLKGKTATKNALYNMLVELNRTDLAPYLSRSNKN